MPEERNEHLELLESRSEDVQEILGYVPRWIVRWGITVIFISILVLLVGSWFFRYPELYHEFGFNPHGKWGKPTRGYNLCPVNRDR